MNFQIGKLLLCCVVLGLSACQIDPIVPERDPLDSELIDLIHARSNGGGLMAYILPASDKLNAIPQDPNNPLTKEKVELGMYLYHDTGLGINPQKTEGMYTYSCASCHHVDAGFQAGIRQGIGEGGMGFGFQGEQRKPNPAYVVSDLDIQPIRSPSTLNVAYQNLMLWNGQFGATGMNVGTESKWTSGTPVETNHMGYEGVETQAIAGLTVHRVVADTALMHFTEYKNLFTAAFPGIPEPDCYSRETAGLAIAAYERTLLPTDAPFQKWLTGEFDAMTEQEKRGAILFFGKANCVSCHQGPALNQMKFYALGMNDLEGSGVYGASPAEAVQKGRGGFTGNAADDYKFKVPQLYNLKDSPFYGHGGSFRNLRAVVAYKNAGIPEKAGLPASQLAVDFQPLGLTDEEVDDIAVFLETGLYDPNLNRYVPGAIPTDNCFPVNDQQAKDDLGCN